MEFKELINFKRFNPHSKDVNKFKVTFTTNNIFMQTNVYVKTVTAYGDTWK